MGINYEKIKHWVFLLSFLLFYSMVYSQTYKDNEAQVILKGSQLLRINEYTQRINYALFNEKVISNKNEIVPYLLKALNLNPPYQLQLIKSEVDDIGFEHLRFQQTYNQIPILGGIVIAHLKENTLHSFNGEVFEVNNEALKKRKSADECLNKALEIIQAKTYKWQMPEEEEAIKIIKDDPNASWYPKAQLVYCPKDLNFDHPIFELSYQFTIHANEPLLGENIYISPINLGTIARENLIHTTDVIGTAVTKYSGTKKITTDSTSTFNFRLRESGRGGGIYTLNMKKGTSYAAAVDFVDSNNIWNNVNTNKDEIATDAHWGAEVTYDYFLKTHNRKSYNNNNARIYSYVHYSNNYDNAFWNGVAMTYGDGNSFKPLTSIDVCGHEIAHAVTSSSANLIYSNESGALNESFSDIFGNTIERYGRPTQYDWKIGEDITTGATGLRNMLNPKLKNHPRCYKSTFWYSGTGDNGGVHTNSGVQNWWYYLITEGGKGTNDVANVYSVDSLGILKAEKIAYRNLTVYLTPSSNYNDARFYSIRAAVDLFGDCGKEVIAVTNAWYACNVGNKYDSGYVKANFIADTMVCNKSSVVKFNNLSSNSNKVKWYFGDGNTSVVYHANHTYGNYGNYSVKLVAYSCFKNKSDSITKVSYVKVDSTFDLCNSVIMPQTGLDSTSKCQSFVYDDGGEGIYKQQNNTFLRISVPGSDSIVFRFLDFDYENKYDSLYIYKGNYPGGTLLGGFTGATLPFAGKKIKVLGGLITLRHRSDQLVTGRGFKMHYTAYKQPVDLSVFRDTTICKGNSVWLFGKGKGGHVKDYVYTWRNLTSNDSIMVSPKIPTTYKLLLTDVCIKSVDSGEVFVNVRDSLQIAVSKDSTICIGQSVPLQGVANGGLNTSYQFIWDNGLVNGDKHTVSPKISTTYRVILKDGCTVENDTSFIKITVRDSLKTKLITTDTLICNNKFAALSATGLGGKNSTYSFTWDNGLGLGISKSIQLTKSTWVKVTLSDACTLLPSKDSVLIKVRAPLTVSLNNDTIICKGTSLTLNALPNGGAASNYTYTWNQGLSSKSSHSVNPSNQTMYVLTLSDNCSENAKDSLLVGVLQSLKISGLKDTVICYNGNANLNPLATGGKPLQYTYHWDNGLNTNKNQSVSPKLTTTYKLVLKDNCTTINDSFYVKVTVLPALKLNSTLTKNVMCDGDSILLNLSNTGGLPAQYKWYENGVETFKTSYYLKPKLSANYKINTSDNCSNSDSVLFAITVNPLPVIDFTSDKKEICRNMEVQFSNLTTGALSYKWDFGDGGLNNTFSPKYKYVTAGIFDVKLIATSVDGCSNTIIKPLMITVVELPVSDFTFTPDDPKLPDPVVTFTNLASNYSWFEWDFGDLNTESINSNPIHTYKDKGLYKVKLVTGNYLGCTDTLIKSLLVEDVYFLWVPNAFSPNNDGINDELKIISKGILVSDLAIYNRWGEKVYQSDLNGKPFDGKDKDGKSLQVGSYILEITLRDYTKRFHIVRKVIEII
jgi:bacillolysin